VNTVALIDSNIFFSVFCWLLQHKLNFFKRMLLKWLFSFRILLNLFRRLLKLNKKLAWNVLFDCRSVEVLFKSIHVNWLSKVLKFWLC
jgi:hypothetical protein